MKQPEIKAYEGKDGYIFISYSHRDKETVYPFVAALQNNYNVWFDEGIHYGHEWEKEIADKLRGCSIFIFMITGNSLDSENCMDELYHARTLKKNFINVLLDDEAELPEWFVFRYARYQMCNYRSFASPEAAIADLERKCSWFRDVKNDRFEKTTTKIYKNGHDAGLKPETPKPERPEITVREDGEKEREAEKRARHDAIERARRILEENGAKEKAAYDHAVEIHEDKHISEEKPDNACKKCGAKLPDGAAFCTSCGARCAPVEVGHANFCEACGAKLQPGALFCTSCGKKIRTL